MVYNVLLTKSKPPAMELLIREIKKRPALHGVLKRKDVPESEWDAVISAVHEKFPEVDSRMAWRSWYCVMYQHRNTLSGLSGRFPDLDDILGPRKQAKRKGRPPTISAPTPEQSINNQSNEEQYNYYPPHSSSAESLSVVNQIQSPTPFREHSIAVDPVINTPYSLSTMPPSYLFGNFTYEAPADHTHFRYCLEMVWKKIRAKKAAARNLNDLRRQCMKVINKIENCE
ncbi:hypothetical protein QR680_019343 [Steinernema hermaphroditum]|uniref:Uncharacterized protein n=1 Tax=Steinernema hermaphroditum TaxID=289476 RepID=A0AA39GQV0_9BILA|nr:hypothetical protein QR680_019343 [Steinernema hermaphroditum]